MSNPKELLNPKQTKLAILAALVTAGTLLSSCGTSSSIKDISSKKTAISETGESPSFTRDPSLEVSIRPRTKEESLQLASQLLNDHTYDTVVLLDKPVLASGVVLSCPPSACAAITAVGATGDEIIGFVAQSAELSGGISATGVAAGFAVILLPFTQGVQGSIQGYDEYTYNPQTRSWQMNEVPYAKGAINRLKVTFQGTGEVIQLFGKEIARVGNKDQVDGEQNLEGKFITKPKFLDLVLKKYGSFPEDVRQANIQEFLADKVVLSPNVRKMYRALREQANGSGGPKKDPPNSEQKMCDEAFEKMSDKFSHHTDTDPRWVAVIREYQAESTHPPIYLWGKSYSWTWIAAWMEDFCKGLYDVKYNTNDDLSFEARITKIK